MLQKELRSAWLETCKRKVWVQCGVPASHSVGQVLMGGTRVPQIALNLHGAHLTGTITPGKPSKVGAGRPRQPHKLLQPPAEGTWQCINLLHSHIQPTQSCFLYPAIIQVAHFLLTISAFLFFSPFSFGFAAPDWNVLYCHRFRLESKQRPFLPRAHQSSTKTGRWGSKTDMTTKTNIKCNKPVGMGRMGSRHFKCSLQVWVRHAACFDSWGLVLQTFWITATLNATGTSQPDSEKPMNLGCTQNELSEAPLSLNF